MLRKQLITSLTVLLLTLTAHGQTAIESMKGYELYSWKIKGHWYYSLLPRANRLKSYEEITARSIVKRDTAGLKTELQKLPKGEDVFWMSDAPAGAGKSAAGQTLNIKHPSRKRINRIKAICGAMGINLRLS